MSMWKRDDQGRTLERFLGYWMEEFYFPFWWWVV